MKDRLPSSLSTYLPIKRNLTLAYILSPVVAFLMIAASIGGLLYPSAIYPTDESYQSFVTNDMINLLIGLPILLGSIWLTRRGKLIGLLFWPGALLYVIYNYTAYVFGMPFSLVTLAFLALVLLSAYILFDLLKSIDKKSVGEQLSGVVPVKTSGWVLALFGVAFFFRAIGMLAEASMNQTNLLIPEIGTLIADMILSVLWVSGGILLLRRKPLGYVSGLGLLFAVSMLFIGLIVFLLLQPALTNAPFALADVIAVLAMSLICFIPFGLFVRGVVSKGKSS